VGRYGARKLAPREGTGSRELSPGRVQASQAVARMTDAPLSPRPGQAVAVARGAGVRKVWRDTAGASRECVGSDTDPSPMSDVVTEMPRTPVFLPCCATPTYALRVLTVL